MEKTPRTQLDRAAWIQAAFETLAEQGVGGIRVETLAKLLHVTKGSFYWHFKDRQALLDALLETWKDSRIRDIIKQTRYGSGSPTEQLFHVIDIYSTSHSDKGIRIELAMRDWARRDGNAELTVEEVDSARLSCARELFMACGLSVDEASTHSVLLYAYVFGVSMLSCRKFDRDLSQIKADIRHIIAAQPKPAPAAPSEQA